MLDNLSSKGKLFADDAKIYRKMDSTQDRYLLQDDLNKLHTWSQKWLMGFNQAKCKVMHMGRKNPRNPYKLGGTRLQETERERDLGVLVTNDMNSGL